MLRSMSAVQLQQWRAYAELEPFDETRADLRAAQIVATLANIHRDPKTRSKPYTVEEMCLRFELQEAKANKQTWQQQLQVAKQLVKIFNSTGKQSPRK